jgi:hypothetical protein
MKQPRENEAVRLNLLGMCIQNNFLEGVRLCLEQKILLNLGCAEVMGTQRKRRERERERKKKI